MLAKIWADSPYELISTFGGWILLDSGLRLSHSLATAGIMVALSVTGLFSVGLLSGAQGASASSSLSCKDSLNNNVNATSIPLNTVIKCRTISTNDKANEFHFWVESPTGTQNDTGITSYVPGTTMNFKFIADQPGDWSVHTIYYHGTDQERICLCNMHVTFFVLPESSIGAIGMIGSSLAALGLFVRYTRSKSNKASTEQN